MLRYDQLEDELNSYFKTNWDYFLTNGIPTLGISSPNLAYNPRVEYPNVELEDFVDIEQIKVRLTYDDVDSSQKSFTGGRADQIGTLFRSVGIIVVQLFLPKSKYVSKHANEFSLAIQRMYQSKTSSNGVCFRNAIINKQPTIDKFFQYNISCDYEYDTKN